MFAGREHEILCIAALAREGREISIFGEAGVGKSALARRVIESLNVLPRAGRSHQAKPLRSGKTVHNTVSAAMRPWRIIDLSAPGAYAIWLSHINDPAHTNAHWLIDNADQYLDTLGHWITTKRAQGALNSVILTSREPLWHPQVERLNLRPLSIEAGGAASALFRMAIAAQGSAIALDHAWLDKAVRASEGIPDTLVLAARRAVEIGPADVLGWLAEGHHLDVVAWHGAPSLAARIRPQWVQFTPIERRILVFISHFSSGISPDLLRGLTQAERKAFEGLAASSLILHTESPKRCALTALMRAFVRRETDSDTSAQTELVRTVAKVAQFETTEVLDLDTSLCPFDSAEDAWALVPTALNAGDWNTAERIAFAASRWFLIRGPVDIYQTLITDLLAKVPEGNHVSLQLVRGMARLFSGIFDAALADFDAVIACEIRVLVIQALSKRGLCLGLQGSVKLAFEAFNRAEALLSPYDSPNLTGLVLKDRANILVEIRDGRARETIARARQCFLRVKNDRALWFLDILGATRACDEGDVETVKLLVARVLPQLVAGQEERPLTRVNVILGVALLAAGHLNEAVAPLNTALAGARRLADYGSAGQAGCYAAQCAIESGRFLDGCELASAAAEDLRHFNDPVWHAHAKTLLAAALLAAHKDELALDALTHASRLLRGTKTSIRRAAVVETMRCLRLIVRGQTPSAAEGPCEEDRSTLRLVLSVTAARHDAPAATNNRQFELTEHGAVFWNTEGQRVELEKFPILYAIFALLLKRHYSAPDEFVSTSEMIAEVWPGERITPSAAKNRIYVAIWRLRTLGLDAVLEMGIGASNNPGWGRRGYRLAPAALQIPAKLSDDKAIKRLHRKKSLPE